MLCLVALLSFLGAALGPVPVGGAATTSGTYVALGDSYTSGPMVPNMIPGAGLCGRSDHDYPALVAYDRRVPRFRDVSCGGASIGHLWLPQLPGTPPQLEAVTADTALVTLGIGANDIGLMGIAATCGALGLADPLGSPCHDHYTAGGVDQNELAIAQLRPRIGDALAAIRQRAPRARILVVGYPVILPPAGPGCWPRVSIAAGDLPYFSSVEQLLNVVLAGQAARAGATFVDTYASSVGHDVCRDSGFRWVEWVLLGAPAAPIHPNVLSMQNDAVQVVAALRRQAG